MTEKKKVGRPSHFEASYVHAIAEQLTLAYLRDNPKVLIQAIKNKRDYLLTLGKSERVLQQAVRVRQALLVHKASEFVGGMTDSDIAFTLMLASRPNQYINRRQYAREQADEGWIKGQRIRLDGTHAGQSYVRSYREVMEAKRRVDENDPLVLKTPDFTPAKRKSTAKPKKLLPEFEDQHGEEDFI